MDNIKDFKAGNKNTAIGYRMNAMEKIEIILTFHCYILYFAPIGF